MKKIKILAILFLVAISLTAITLKQPNLLSKSAKPTEPDWGWPTHHKIVRAAINDLPTSWIPLMDYYESELIGGSTLPDTWGDWNNHLWYPTESDGGGNTAPSAIKRWFNFMKANLTAGNYEDAILAFGVGSHYIADISWAVHTDEYWEGHPAVETAVNTYIEDFSLGSLEPQDNLTDATIEQAVKDWATTAHQYYDLIRDAYPDETVHDACITDSELKAAIEEMLTKSATNVLSVWLSAIKESKYLAPSVNVLDTESKILIDNRTWHDYYNELNNIGGYLENLGFQIVYDDDGITASDLEDVRLLIITAIYDDGGYTSAELQALQDWSNDATSMKDIFVTGRGDYNPINHTAINEVLDVIGSNTRINDDNVYTIPEDPNFYESWYVYTDNIRLPDETPLPNNTEILNHFSPSSLYFTNDFNGQILSNGTQYDYQSNENDPAPAVIWDDTDDGTGGEVIPFISQESDETTNTRFTVFGDTSFSDFSFSTSDFHDNLEYMKAYLNLTLDLQNIANPIGPRVSIDNYNLEAGELEFTVSKSTEYVEIYIDDTYIGNKTSITTASNKFPYSDLSIGTYDVKLVAYGNGWSFETIQQVEVSSSTSSSTASSKSSEDEQFSPSFTYLPILLSFALIYFKRRKR